MSAHWGRRIANVPPDALTDVKRKCGKCKLYKPIKGGSLMNHRFICAACK